MIVREKPGRFDLLLAIRGSVVPAIAPRIATLMVISAAMVWLHSRVNFLPRAGEFGFTVFGIALSLFLGFRNNAAYDRWWEARKLWGGLLADLRSLAREASIFIADEEPRRRLIRCGLAFLHRHRQNLRGIDSDEEASAWGGQAVFAGTACGALNCATEIVARARINRQVDGFGAKALAERLSSMTQQQAAGERIANTPLPFVYSLLIYRTTYIYCLLLPLALAEPAGWLTPLFVGIVAYVFLGLAEVSEELSQPFGTTQNALPLDAICRAAEISLAPHLGEEPPTALVPANFYLS